ncbi:unnamed protein product [Pseudo-nitzschia multistriata]|uniref:Mitochondrial carrier protein n=1 Tax=Pseudo-nitzschia multistriata TaxID=183589 RepID=A0A448YUA9_9STRA|nr:unnamed protein product [Pseudo-nitzschia multistriata]
MGPTETTETPRNPRSGSSLGRGRRRRTRMRTPTRTRLHQSPPPTPSARPTARTPLLATLLAVVVLVIRSTTTTTAFPTPLRPRAFGTRSHPPNSGWEPNGHWSLPRTKRFLAGPGAEDVREKEKPPPPATESTPAPDSEHQHHGERDPGGFPSPDSIGGDLPFFASPAAEQHTNTGTTDRSLSRRDAFRYGAVLAGAAWATGVAYTQTAELEAPPPKRPSLIPEPVLPIAGNSNNNNNNSSNNNKAPEAKQPRQEPTKATTAAPASAPAPSGDPLSVKSPSGQSTVATGRLESVNLTQVASETNINVTMNCEKMCLSVDSSNFTFTKVEKPKVPSWLPSFLAPKSQVVKKYSNAELLVAATAAGSVCEMGRTSLLYPLSTIKTRLQADRHDTASDLRPGQSFWEQVQTLAANVKEKAESGNLYAGISPTLLVSVPATGIYYGARDVTKRMLYFANTPLDATSIALIGALVGDVVSLCFRTPSNALAIRLQARSEAAPGDWLGESLERLPVIILTDLPYLLSKIVLNKLFIQGSLSVPDYAGYAVLAAVLAALLTTPFDVAQTRILLEPRPVPQGERAPGAASATEESTGGAAGLEATLDAIAPGRPDRGLVQTMVRIANEGDGGVRNLFSGWLERVVYLGIGRAWLEPIQLVEYIGIRDAVLLEWF